MLSTAFAMVCYHRTDQSEREKTCRRVATPSVKLNSLPKRSTSR
ncbi:hypothetical protein RMSM_02978 [Rhodopirellula maiorica SM1]|uniref:Uncharacterized protein n=1 Tax=Rhodopirellula maiorica SM1 TaxID=1265738 RepID=M5RL91_9BACT|nr:hypothetical protein RMSM_02978 [Rhodopirellula maiorica SM1]